MNYIILAFVIPVLISTPAYKSPYSNKQLFSIKFREVLLEGLTDRQRLLKSCRYGAIANELYNASNRRRKSLWKRFGIGELKFIPYRKLKRIEAISKDLGIELK